ncbi:DUF1534 domain-containing protein, partial [Pseudomonas viridiflava]|uniref:DUF1534 domain-containing protein n=1 Tax=Pseudomonas viridiflava TaxID=33069 RepID=UPI001F3FA442
LSTGVGMIGVLEITLIVPTLQRGNAARDAPRHKWSGHRDFSVYAGMLSVWNDQTPSVCDHSALYGYLPSIDKPFPSPAVTESVTVQSC